MKVFTTAQIKDWEQYTLRHEQSTALHLMERAAQAFSGWLKSRYPAAPSVCIVLCGTGNNGGDGMAIARLLHEAGWNVEIMVADFSSRHSPEFVHQLGLLEAYPNLSIRSFKKASEIPVFPQDCILVDALLGIGLSRPIEGELMQLINRINDFARPVLAVDMPTGLFAEAHTPHTGVVKATYTLTFESPRLAFFFPENADYVGEWDVRSIGLTQAYKQHTSSDFEYLTRDEARQLLRHRKKFSHKGSFGHSLLIAGGEGKMGAAVLAAKACLRAGAGLLTVRTPGYGLEIMQSSVPEAICDVDAAPGVWSHCPDVQCYTAIGVGCGIGTADDTAVALERLLRQSQVPMVLDADALNLLARHPHWWSLIPKGSLLTPHPKEFERLFGPSAHDFARNGLQRDMAREQGVYILLKGAYSAMACPDGSCWFNTTGNPGMATAGSGDVLAGILTGLLAQGYDPKSALLLGVYLHGLAGDLAAAERSQHALMASDITDWLGKAWLHIENANTTQPVR